MTEFDELLQEFLSAKADEEAARERRYAAERKIAEACGSKEEGQISRKGTAFKAVAKYKINRTLDPKVWEEVAPTINPAIAANIVRWKPEIVLKGLRWVEENDQETYGKIARAITSKPAKVAISVEEIK